jgi:hypothetical protein
MLNAPFRLTSTTSSNASSLHGHYQAVLCYAGVVDEYVDRAERRFHGFHRLFGGLKIGHVALKRLGLHAAFTRGLYDFPRLFRIAGVDHGNIRAERGEFECDSPTDPPGRARDERHFSVKHPRAPPPRFIEAFRVLHVQHDAAPDIRRMSPDKTLPGTDLDERIRASFIMFFPRFLPPDGAYDLLGQQSFRSPRTACAVTLALTGMSGF